MIDPMQHKLTTLTLVAVLLLAVAPCCLARQGKPVRRQNTWPRDPVLLLERLNSWDKGELDASERPRAQGGRISSGETNGWIVAHKSMLHAIGYEVRWVPAKRRYVFKGRAAQDWVAKGRTAYVGRYETSPFIDNDPRDRAAGRGGSGVKVKASLEISRRGRRYTARYRVTPVDKPGQATTAQLSGVLVKSNQITTTPVVIKSAWPYYLPTVFEGRFVKPSSLIFGGRLYRRVGSR